MWGEMVNNISIKAEELLNEILDHRDNNGNCNTYYWKDRFESLPMSEDAILRSLFRELQEADLISVRWADNYPYILFVLGNGVSYFEEKQKARAFAKGNSFTNNFYANVSNIQIQQGSANSSQTQTVSQLFDNEKINELLQMLKKYDAVLDDEFGVEGAGEIRAAAQSLDVEINDNRVPKKIMGVLEYIRDLSVNAGGGLIAAGIIQLITSILG